MTTTDSKCFQLQIEDGIAHLVMSRPEKLNSMTWDFWRELPELVRQIDREASARVIVLSAQGRHFTAGMDLANFTAGSPFADRAKDPARQAEASLHNLYQLQDSISSLEQARVPVICAIQGACVGGGVDMVSAADLRYCTEDARFCIQETNIGIVADIGTLQRLPKLIPAGVVRELALTGDNLPAQRALELGLVNGVFADQPTMLAEVDKVARRIANHSPLVTAGVKSALNYARDHSVSEGLEQIALWNASMLSRQDLGEAMRAYAEKSQPAYEDLQPKRDYWDSKKAG